MRPSADAPSLDVLVLGEALVDLVSGERGPLRRVSSLEVHPGGAPSNVAIGAARLGVRAGLISVVGDDEFGAYLLGALDAAGVERSGVRITRGASGLCFVSLDDRGERSFLHRGGEPVLELAAGDVRPTRAAAARTVCFGFGALRTEGGVAAVDALIEHAGGLVTCDPGACPPRWGPPDLMRSRLRRVIPRCHVVKCSSDEVGDVTGFADPESASAWLTEAQGVPLAIVTIGAEGAVWARRGERGRVPPAPAEVVDTTGAGDGFMAALLARLSAEPGDLGPQTLVALSREALEGHLAFACRIGAAVVGRRGATAGIPDLRGPR